MYIYNIDKLMECVTFYSSQLNLKLALYDLEFVFEYNFYQQKKTVKIHWCSVIYFKVFSNKHISKLFSEKVTETTNIYVIIAITSV